MPEPDATDAVIKASLVICTRNRASQLARCLDSVRQIRCRYPWQLVLVDNGSTDETALVIARFAESEDMLVTAAFERLAGLGRARNAGLAAARGEILAFIDDDCYPAPDHLERVVEAFERYSIGWLGGGIRLYDERDFPLTISLLQNDMPLPAGRYLWPGLIQGANMAFRRCVLEHIGGFDSELGPGTKFILDDIDAVARASAAGFDGGFFTSPCVLHHHGRKAKDAARLQAAYDSGHGAYFMKLLADPMTRRRFGWRVIAELCRSALRQPRVFGRELAGAIQYLARHRDARRNAPQLGALPKSTTS